MKLKYIHEADTKTKVKYILRDKLYISNILLRKLKEANAIYLNSKPIFVNYQACKNDVIEVDLDKIEEKPGGVIPTKRTLDILYEDEYILALNKPCGIDIHPCMANFENSLANYIMYYYNKQGYNISKIHIITRLDKNTSGVCLIAKNEYIQELFLRKKDSVLLTKEYIAVCSGILKSNHFFIEKNIERKPGSIILRRTSASSGEYAKTEVFVQKRLPQRDYTICRVLLHTGRTHQIRVHFSSIGHSLLGDDLYAGEYMPNYDIMKYISRQALHAFKLSFNHPVTNAKMEIISPIPEDIEKLQ